MYSKLHADFYDQLYADRPYETQVRFLQERFRSYGVESGRLLELACGTGTHALLFEKAGFRVVGIDRSHGMIEAARHKAASRGCSAEFRIGDMENPEISAGSADCCICLFDSIGHLVSKERVRNALKNLHQILRPGGVAAFEYWHAEPALSEFEPLRVREMKTPTGDLIRIARTEIGDDRETLKVAYEFIELRADGTYRRLFENHENRCFWPAGFDAMLEESGFKGLKSFSGYSLESVSKSTWHVVVTAQA